MSTTDGNETVHEEEELTLRDEGRYAYAALCATILASDFAEDYNRDFAKKTLLFVCKHLNLPKKTTEAITKFSKNDQVDHLAPSIVALKQEPLVQREGGLVVAVDLVAAFVATGDYDARYRIIVRHVAALLSVDWLEVEMYEGELATSMGHAPGDNETEEEAVLRKKRERVKKLKRYTMIGATGAIGGVLIGLTGGLAAPLFAAGAGVFVGSAAAAGIATTAGAAVLGSLFGVAGAGLAGYKMNRRVGALEEFSFEPLSEGKSLHIMLTVCGWISDDTFDAFTFPWRHLRGSAEQYSLRYESKYLSQLGNAISYLTSWAVSYAIQTTLMETALAGMVAAIAWPAAVLSVGTVIDNPWNVCIRRAEEAGKHLAHILLSRQQGKRPTSLIGFSLGARVIYHCLLEMTKQHAQPNIVEDVVLLGAPVSGSKREWESICRVVGGRVINGYCPGDWILKFLYRTMNIQISIAGVAPVKTGLPKIVNYNLSGIVEAHSDYNRKLTEILHAVGVKVDTIHSSNLTSVVSTPQSGVMRGFPSSGTFSSLQAQARTPTTDSAAGLEPEGGAEARETGGEAHSEPVVEHVEAIKTSQNRTEDRGEISKAVEAGEGSVALDDRGSQNDDDHNQK